MVTNIINVCDINPYDQNMVSKSCICVQNDYFDTHYDRNMVFDTHYDRNMVLKSRNRVQDDDFTTRYSQNCSQSDDFDTHYGQNMVSNIQNYVRTDVFPRFFGRFCLFSLSRPSTVFWRCSFIMTFSNFRFGEAGSIFLAFILPVSIVITTVNNNIYQYGYKYRRKRKKKHKLLNQILHHILQKKQKNKQLTVRLPRLLSNQVRKKKVKAKSLNSRVLLLRIPILLLNSILRVLLLLL